MATPNREYSAALRERLFDESSRFGFFQAVRLLQLARPECQAVGTGEDPAREALRFSSDCSFNFPTGEIRSTTPSGDDNLPDRMMVTFMGVATPASFGSLPSVFTEQIHEQERTGVTALRDFLDLFNHRFISLFYRAWVKCRPAIAYEGAGRGRDGMFEQAVFSLLGFGVQGLRDQLPIKDHALLSLAAQLRQQPASAAAVGDLVGNYFCMPVEVRQLIPETHVIEDDERCRLGVFACELGQTLTLGSEVSVAQNSFRLRLGPLDWSTYGEFLPGGEGHKALVALLRTAVGLEYDFDFQMVLAADSVPSLCLVVPDDPQACRLGWSTWLCTEPLAQDPSNVYVSSEF